MLPHSKSLPRPFIPSCKELHELVLESREQSLGPTLKSCRSLGCVCPACSAEAVQVDHLLAAGPEGVSESCLASAFGQT